MTQVFGQKEPIDVGNVSFLPSPYNQDFVVIFSVQRFINRSAATRFGRTHP